jgi:pimeloyl-ACP methyl ester carboxylesterase
MRDLKRQSPDLPDALLETMRRNLSAPGAATAMLAYYRANLLRIGREAQRTPTIACPTLLLWGEDDAYLSPTLAAGNEAFVSNLAVHRLPGVSHWVQADAPEQVNRLIAEWAREQGLAG